MDVKLVSYIGGANIALIPHFINHYRELGIRNFQFIAANESNVLQTLAENNIKPKLIDSVAFDVFHKQDLINSLIVSSSADQWFILVDLDEFLVLKNSLEKTIESLVNQKYHAAKGMLIDRHAPDGKLIDLQAVKNIWQSFPCTSQFSKEIGDLPTEKICLLHGGVKTTPGSHFICDSSIYKKITSNPLEIHHFKWDKTAIKRILNHVDRYMNDKSQDKSSMAKGSLRILQCLCHNNNTVPLHAIEHKNGGGFYDRSLKPMYKQRLKNRWLRKINTSFLTGKSFLRMIIK